ncbi:MAG: VapC toxin family PIN domain ribonuclease [Nitrospirae bacterium]|nr:VapC toxin family PIN domain ribonuclease [Nitrospirota bacterium]
MRVYVDTSAFYSVLDADDRHHSDARRTWMDAVRVFHDDVTPVVQMVWVDEPLHRAASSALLTAGQRRLRLVDCLSFVVMRQAGIETVFAMDAHFIEQGFPVLPSLS